MALKDRPSSDLIVFFLTGLVGVVIVGVLGVIIYLDVTGSHGDAGEAVTWIARITNTMIGGIFGYLAGRSVGKNGGNGGSGTHMKE